MIVVHNIYNYRKIKFYTMYRYLLRSEKANIFNSLADTAEILDDTRFLFTSAILKLFHSEARFSPVLLASHVAQKPRSAIRRPFFSAPWFYIFANLAICHVAFGQLLSVRRREFSQKMHRKPKSHNYNYSHAPMMHIQKPTYL